MLEEIFKLIKRGSATGSIYLLNYIPSNLLQLSFFTGNMVYALFGYLGFIYLYRILKTIFVEKEVLSKVKFLSLPIVPWILFLPNLHFWSSGIGKDSILFTCIISFVYGLQKIRKRWFLLLLALLLSLAIRPHITLFLLIAFGIGFMLDGNLKAYQKGFIFVVFVAGFIAIFDYVLTFVQLESLESNAIEQYASTKAAKLNQVTSGSGIDISGYPFPLKVVTFLYRPFFFDVNGILAVVASFENLILLIFSIKLLFKKPWQAFKNASSLLKGMLIFFLLGTVSFSLILGNLGIMLRQKNMFIPFFIVFGIWVLYQFNLSKNSTIESSTSHK
ncbi:hypothetical protein ACFQO1_06895 [Jejudonia soesokkakensis]|uniref:Glycosyltransferase RgtA/B/C/D-like domain-containing protein n=1 Tax=Jejudonia soesokkakensis TaxID=1323432 RepID=A0ABW2MV52_9FLAO